MQLLLYLYTFVPKYILAVYKVIFVLMSTFFLVSPKLDAQCIVDSSSIVKFLGDLPDKSEIIGQWNVGLRATLLYRNSVLESDFSEYDVNWFIVPDGGNLKVCALEMDQMLGLKDAFLINDEAIDGQYFFYGDNGDNKIDVTIAKLVTPDIFSLHFQPGPETVKNYYKDKVKEEKMNEVNILWEYILTRVKP